MRAPWSLRVVVYASGDNPKAMQRQLAKHAAAFMRSEHVKMERQMSAAIAKAIEDNKDLPPGRHELVLQPVEGMAT